MVKGLVGIQYQYSAVRGKLEELFSENQVEVPGVSVDDIWQAILANNRGETIILGETDGALLSRVSSDLFPKSFFMIETIRGCNSRKATLGRQLQSEEP